MNADRLQKAQEIKALERRIAQALARTPYIMLLSIPGVNVVSAAEFAASARPTLQLVVNRGEAWIRIRRG